MDIHAPQNEQKPKSIFDKTFDALVLKTPHLILHLYNEKYKFIPLEFIILN
jgi:hypothetical protein